MDSEKVFTAANSTFKNSNQKYVYYLATVKSWLDCSTRSFFSTRRPPLWFLPMLGLSWERRCSDPTKQITTGGLKCSNNLLEHIFFTKNPLSSQTKPHQGRKNSQLICENLPMIGQNTEWPNCIWDVDMISSYGNRRTPETPISFSVLSWDIMLLYRHIKLDRSIGAGK